MSSIRALTLFLDDVSTAAESIASVLNWEVTSDFGTFASIEPQTGMPLWLNVPDDNEATSSGILVHLIAEDVDEAFELAILRGAVPVRPPADMDYGERSAWVRIEGVPGITFDFSKPLAT